MKSFDERLKNHPKLKARFESILDIAENTNEDCTKANDAEERVIEEVRKLGQETLQDWAEMQSDKQIEKALEDAPEARNYKKNSTGIQHMVK